VNVHKNARLTPSGRALLVERIEGGEPVGEVAAAMGVSRKTAYKWVKRWRAEGEAGLVDRSSRPRRSPNRLPRARRRRIEQLRRKGWSSPRIADELKIPLSTVVVTCRRLGLNRLSKLEPPAPVIRYERDRPGELMHLDTKKLARIEAVGHRIHGDRRRMKRGVGWEYFHACLDDATRSSYGEVLPDEKGATAAAFLQRAAAWFRRQGVGMERVMTDNGSCYRSKVFRRTVRELGARQIYTRPYTPRTNGKVERFIRTALELWAYARPYGHSNERNAQLRPFLNFYNCARPHWGIGRKTPQQRLVELRVDNVLTSNS
jgi:transposase InsO family protein